MISKLVLDIAVLVTAVNGSCSKEYKESLSKLKKDDLLMLKESYEQELSITIEN
jgi:hypothetical protein